jgi:hypothetical protein
MDELVKSLISWSNADDLIEQVGDEAASDVRALSPLEFDISQVKPLCGES